MNFRTCRAFGLLAIVTVLGAGVVNAQQRAQGRTRTPTIDRSQQRDQDQNLDRDRTFDRDRDRDRDTADRDRDQDRDRDTLHTKDRDRLRDRDVYGSSLMTQQELDQYRERLRTITTDREWARIRAEHQEQMQARARERGVELTPPLYGQYLLTAREQERYRSRLQRARTEQARIALRKENQDMAWKRSRELGVDLPAPVYGQQLMTEQEQAQYRERLRVAANEQERERLRNEHRQQMQERARQNEVALDELESS